MGIKMLDYMKFSGKNLVVIIIFCLFVGCSGKTDKQYSELAISYLEREHYDDAISALRKELKLNPASAEARFNLGRAYKKKGMDKKAMKEFTLSYRISTEKFDGYIKKYNEEVELEINDIQYLIELGNTYVDKGMVDKAISTFEKLLKLEPENIHAHYTLGISYSKKGMRDKAVNELKKTIEIDKDMPEAHYSLGLLYYKQGKTDMAIPEYKTTLDLLPEARGRKRASVYYKLGLAYYDNGMFDEAINALNKALETTPNDARVHYQLSKVYKENGMFDKAEKELEIYKKLKIQK